MPYISDFPFRFGPAPCCCPDPGCQAFADDFSGGNTTDLGPNWNEISPSAWEKFNEMLHEKEGTSEGTDGAKIFCTIPTSVASPGMMYMQVTILFAAIGDKFSLYSCAESSSSLGSGVEVTFEMLPEIEWRVPGTPDWLVTIVGGTAEGTVIQSTTSNAIAYVCADHRVEMVTAGFVNTNDEKAWEDHLDPGEGRYCGLGHSNPDTGAFFDDFYKVELHSGTTECTNCVCQCQEYGLKRSLVATVFGVELYANANIYEAIEGDTFTLEYDYDGIHPDPTWYGTWINSQTPPGPFIIDMYLRCSGGWTLYPDLPGYNITLNFGQLTTSVCHDQFQGSVCQNAKPDPQYSTCSPLNLVYGWFYAWIDPGPDARIARYKIRVTEA